MRMLTVFHLFFFSLCGVSAGLLPHPRLILTPLVLARLQANIRNDQVLAGYYRSVKEAATSLLGLPLTPYSNCTVVGACRNAAVFGEGAQYLQVGTAGNILLTLSLVHLVEAEGAPLQPTPWSNRAVAELLHVCGPAWPSWYWPVGQALERAGIAHSVGLAYDWLHPLLSPAQRAVVAAALHERAFTTRLRDEREGLWWIGDVGNWAINANLPLLTAALAVGDEPEHAGAAAAVMAVALQGASTAMGMWAPNGLWPEGPGYGSYSHGSWLQPCAALASSGYAPTPPPLCAWGAGVCAYPHTAVALVGPRGHTHNWGDGEEGQLPTPSLFAASTGCASPMLAAAARALRAAAPPNATSPWDVIFYSAAGTTSHLAAAALPLAVVLADPSPDGARGRKTHVGAFRSGWAWDNPGNNASASVWLSFKGGNNHFDDHGSQSHNNHGHLDVGSFVFEAQGVRWAVDLGADSYDYPLLSYFGRFRFSYYYLTSLGHNVLAFDEDTQHRRGTGGVLAASVGPGAPPFALMDTTTAYGGASNVTRNFTLLLPEPPSDADAAAAAAHAPAALAATAAGCVPARITDTWVHPTATLAHWRMHTTASVQRVTVGGVGGLLLTEAALPGATLLLTAVPESAVWNFTTLDLPPPQSTLYRGGAAGAAGGGAAITVITATVSAAGGSLQVTLSPCAQGL